MQFGSGVHSSIVMFAQRKLPSTHSRMDNEDKLYPHCSMDIRSLYTQHTKVGIVLFCFVSSMYVSCRVRVFNVNVPLFVVMPPLTDANARQQKQDQHQHESE